MELRVESGDLADVKADVVIVNLFEGVTTPGGATGAVDAAMGGAIAGEITGGRRFKGKLGETLVLPTLGKLPARTVVVIGLGKAEDFKGRQLRRAAAAAIRVCVGLKAASVATILHGAGIGNVDPQVAARLVAEGTLMGAYKFTLRKSAKPDEAGGENPLENPVKTVTILEKDGTKLDAIREGVRVGSAIAAATNRARDLVADSANFVTPTMLAELAQGIQGQGVSCKILEKTDLQMMGMGSFLGVAQGSDHPPKLIHLSYKPAGTVKRKVTLVGKGITFDSGGLSLKPPAGMELMKMDMGGAAAVLMTMAGVAALGGLDTEVHAIAACCENMPSGHATRPGDILTAMSGKTIEVNNTDAEGRLILCDALTYAQRETDPDALIDLATLTGACVVALGKEASGIMGTCDDLIDGIRTAGDTAGERFWPLPLYDEFKDMLKSDVADMINSGSKGQAGSSAGGMFLKEFIDDKRAWVHLDIAGPAWTDRDIPETPKGATGVGVRTLLYYLYGWKDAD